MADLELELLVTIQDGARVVSTQFVSATATQTFNDLLQSALLDYPHLQRRPVDAIEASGAARATKVAARAEQSLRFLSRFNLDSVCIKLGRPLAVQAAAPSAAPAVSALDQLQQIPAPRMHFPGATLTLAATWACM